LLYLPRLHFPLKTESVRIKKCFEAAVSTTSQRCLCVPIGT
jgi:hypothetical protein